MSREYPSHRVVKVTRRRRRLLFWRFQEVRITVYAGTWLGCERALDALHDIHRSHTYVIELIVPPSTP